MKAWPVVCIAALADLKLRAFRRLRISSDTPTQASGEAARYDAVGIGHTGEQGIDLETGIGRAECEAERRRLLAHATRTAALLRREGGVQVLLESGFTVGGGRFAIRTRQAFP